MLHLHLSPLRKIKCKSNSELCTFRQFYNGTNYNKYKHALNLVLSETEASLNSLRFPFNNSDLHHCGLVEFLPQQFEAIQSRVKLKQKNRSFLNRGFTWKHNREFLFNITMQDFEGHLLDTNHILWKFNNKLIFKLRGKKPA